MTTAKRFNQLRPWLGYLLLAVVAYIPLLYHLDQDSLIVWDESRVAVNAAEMLESQSWIVTTYESAPDLWYTKPPLSVWLCAASMQIFGMNVLAVRLPSALAALALAWMLLWTGRHVLQNARAGWMMALAFLTMRGLICFHVARTGDIDMLLVATMAAFVLGTFTHVYGPEALRKRGLWVAAAGLALALLAKAATVLMLVPGLLTWLALDRQLLPLLRRGRTYLALGVAFAPLLLFYTLREIAAPGYLAATWANDYAGRLLNALEGHEGPWTFYLDLFFKDQLFPYVYVLPLAIWLAMRVRGSLPARLAGLSLGAGLSFLLLISLAGTKLEWYGAPVLMLAAVVLGLGVDAMLAIVLPTFAEKRWQGALMVGLLCFALFGQNFYVLLRRHSAFSPERKVAERYGYAIHDIHRQRPTMEPYYVGLHDYNSSALFYIKQMREENGIQLDICDNMECPPYPRTKVLSCDSALTARLKAEWTNEVIWESGYGCQLLWVKDLRVEKAASDSTMHDHSHGNNVEGKP